MAPTTERAPPFNLVRLFSERCSARLVSSSLESNKNEESLWSRSMPCVRAHDLNMPMASTACFVVAIDFPRWFASE